MWVNKLWSPHEDYASQMCVANVASAGGFYQYSSLSTADPVTIRRPHRQESIDSCRGPFVARPDSCEAVRMIYVLETGKRPSKDPDITK